MKTFIDFYSTINGEFLGAKKFRSRFIRYWGTETIDGVEVLKKKFTLYPGTTTDVNIEKMCKLLGMWSDVKEANFSTIAGYYLFLNPNKDREKQEELSRELLAERIDSYFPVDEWSYVNINFIDKADPTKFDGWSKQQMLDYVDYNYDFIFDGINGSVVGDRLEEDAIAKYVLFDDGTEFEVEILKSQTSSVVKTIAATSWNTYETVETKRVRYTGISIEIRFKRIVEDINPNGVFMNSIKNEQDQARIAALLAMQDSESGGDEFVPQPDKVLTNEIWYKDQMRLDALLANGIKTRDAIESALSVLDTGTIKKKVKWYKKALAPLLIIIAIVIAVVTVGSGAPASAYLTAIAIATGITSLVLVWLQAYWAKTNSAAASYVGRWVTVSSIISIVTGIAAVVASMARDAATESVRQAAIQAIASTSGTTIAQASVTVASMTTAQQVAVTTALNVTPTITANVVYTVVKEAIISNLRSIGMKVASYAVNARREDMAVDLANKQAQYEESQEEVAKLSDKQNHVGVLDIKTYPESLTRIQSRYDIDHLYGPEMSNIHTGNIQVASFYKATGLNLRAEDLV